MQNEGDLYQYKDYTAGDFIAGLFITLGASVLNALGLNITKLDFQRQELLPPSARKPDWMRPYWLLGLALYIASQVIGSTLALNFLRAEYVAPLGSTSLIFNVIFGYLLVGTAITKMDVAGTLVIVLGVIGVVVFGNQRAESEFDQEANLSLDLLKQIWGRLDWIIYFAVLETTTLAFWWISSIVNEVTMERVLDERGEAEVDPTEGMVGRGGRREAMPEGVKGVWVRFLRAKKFARRRIKGVVEGWSQSRADASIRKAGGLSWAITGGVLAGTTLILAKSGVKLITSAIANTEASNPIKSPLTWLIVILLVVSAVAQVVCLNAGLKCFDSTLVVPAFFAVYSITSFTNSLVYLDEFDTYSTGIFVAIWLSIAVLSAGVLMVASKPPPKTRKRANTLTGAAADDGTTPAAGGAGASENPFDDPVATAVPLEDEPAPQGKRQGWLGKMFGGRPEDVAAATSLVSAEAGEAGRAGQKGARKERGFQRLEDDGEDARSGVTALSGRQAEEPEELEMSDVRKLSYEGGEEAERDSIDGLSCQGAGGGRDSVDGLSFGGGKGEEEDGPGWGESREEFGEFQTTPKL